MSSRNTRIILFFCVCVVIRLLFVWLAKNLSINHLKIMGLIALVPVIGFLFQFMFNPSKSGAFGGVPWWNKLRPFHALMYALFFVLAFSPKHNMAWIPLLIDIIVGVIAFSLTYFIM